jgi:predicted TIM-barrel fold metal-dependent hydrolase
MDSIAIAIDHTPIIDHHAHNLLLPNQLQAHSLLSITTEAGGGALRHTSSTISHIRAVTQLSEILGCVADWESVQAAIAEKRRLSDHVWVKQCFEGIETVLIDDGIDDGIVHPWQWHQQLTRTKCKRIVRIEKVAEVILKTQVRPRISRGNPPEYGALLQLWEKQFISAIENAIADPDVAGFKSVICYRTGLAIPENSPDVVNVEAAFSQLLASGSTRLEDQYLSPHFVHLTTKLISESRLERKPLQFHTGLGDNDITLSLASPSHMQPFIKAYPKVPIVLLHAGYPFTKEAGYLASTYENVYLDIGEVFPMVSQDGQENVVRESLELCPSEKLLWSTDGHWFPETYLLAVIQVREAMKQVRQGILSVGNLLTSTLL